MLRRVVTSVEHLARKISIDIELKNNLPVNEEKEYYLHIDAEKLETILVNLCNNAIKFAKPGTSVFVSANLKSDEVIEFSFTNFGKTLTDEEMSEMFDRFKRLEENINSINPGQGLGLSVAKAYAQILDGNMIVSSNKQEGNTFTLQLTIQDLTGEDSVTESDGYELFTEDEELF